MSEKRTVEERLALWAQQPGAVVTGAQRQFIEDMRRARADGVGYGWMQQIIEWEWQSEGIGALGPDYYERRLAEAKNTIAALTKGRLVDP